MPELWQVGKPQVANGCLELQESECIFGQLTNLLLLFIGLIDAQ